MYGIRRLWCTPWIDRRISLQDRSTITACVPGLPFCAEHCQSATLQARRADARTGAHSQAPELVRSVRAPTSHSLLRDRSHTPFPGAQEPAGLRHRRCRSFRRVLHSFVAELVGITGAPKIGQNGVATASPRGAATLETVAPSNPIPHHPPPSPDPAESGGRTKRQDSPEKY